MDIIKIFMECILLFAIIYFSVRLAISPLISGHDGIIQEDNDSGLIKLRDMKVLSYDEYRTIVELYQQNEIKKRKYKQYQKYERVIKELKDLGYFSDKQYLDKMDKLDSYFKVN